MITIIACVVISCAYLQSLVLTQQAMLSSCTINEELRVTVALDSPYVSLKKNWMGLDGNEKYEGYCVDLLTELAEICGFKYKIIPVKDGKFGNAINGTWDGMIGEILRNESDIAVASLTITLARSEVIDFTVPFMHLGISILFQTAKEELPSLFTFLDPFTSVLWGFIVIAYASLSFILCLTSRVSPYERDAYDDDNVQFSMSNSLWFIMAALLAQGTSLDPRAISTRILTVAWWSFAFIVMASYTANLAAFLTVKRLAMPIDSADTLSKQSKIQYGTTQSGSNYAFFKNAQIEPYKTMFTYMLNAQPPVWVANTSEGVARVRRGNYAFLMETATLEYYTEKDCGLVQIGGPLDAKAFGIGMRKGAPYRDMLSQAILRLQENTKLTMLKERWWKDKRSRGECVEDTSQTNALGMENLGGIFVVLACGVGCGILFAICEYLITKCCVKKTITSKPVPFTIGRSVSATQHRTKQAW